MLPATKSKERQSISREANPFLNAPRPGQLDLPSKFFSRGPAVSISRQWSTGRGWEVTSTSHSSLLHPSRGARAAATIRVRGKSPGRVWPPTSTASRTRTSFHCRSAPGSTPGKSSREETPCADSGQGHARMKPARPRFSSPGPHREPSTRGLPRTLFVTLGMGSWCFGSSSTPHELLKRNIAFSPTDAQTRSLLAMVEFFSTIVRARSSRLLSSLFRRLRHLSRLPRLRGDATPHGPSSQPSALGFVGLDAPCSSR